MAWWQNTVFQTLLYSPPPHPSIPVAREGCVLPRVGVDDHHLGQLPGGPEAAVVVCHEQRAEASDVRRLQVEGVRLATLEVILGNTDGEMGGCLARSHV